MLSDWRTVFWAKLGFRAYVVARIDRNSAESSLVNLQGLIILLATAVLITNFLVWFPLATGLIFGLSIKGFLIPSKVAT